MDYEHVTQHIGQTLRQLRKERGWTLDQLAEATEVSKPMLGQIERGESNPTVVTLWKIAGGLQVPFSAFLQDIQQPQVTVIRQPEQPIVFDDNGRYVVKNVLTIQNPQPVELFQVRLQPGCSHWAEAHGGNVTEGVWVKKGSLTIKLAEQSYVLHEGDSLQFVANFKHVYLNQHESVCEFMVLLTYRQGNIQPSQ